MFEFHITGVKKVEENRYYYISDDYADITLFADTKEEAFVKAERVLGFELLRRECNVVAKEIPNVI